LFLLFVNQSAEVAYRNSVLLFYKNVKIYDVVLYKHWQKTKSFTIWRKKFNFLSICHDINCFNSYFPI